MGFAVMELCLAKCNLVTDQLMVEHSPLTVEAEYRRAFTFEVDTWWAACDLGPTSARAGGSLLRSSAAVMAQSAATATVTYFPHHDPETLTEGLHATLHYSTVAGRCG